MSEQRVLLLRKGLVGTCALLALVLLASFYSIVSSAVDRAARQRVEAGGDAIGQQAAQAMHPKSARSSSMLARVGN